MDFVAFPPLHGFPHDLTNTISFPILIPVIPSVVEMLIFIL